MVGSPLGNKNICLWGRPLNVLHTVSRDTSGWVYTLLYVPGEPTRTKTKYKNIWQPCLDTFYLVIL